MEFLKTLIALKESEDSQVELTTFKGKTVPHAAWTEGLTYKGHNVYKIVYDDRPRALEAAEERLKQRDNDGDLDYQEVFLGYSPSEDLFIQGYDGWLSDPDNGHTDNCSPFILFKIMPNGSVKVTDAGIDFEYVGAMWYGRKHPGGYAAVHKKYPDLIDIRLD